MIEGWRTYAQMIGEHFQSERIRPHCVGELRGALYNRCLVESNVCCQDDLSLPLIDVLSN